MKKDTTTILGFMFVAGASIATFGDMYLSTNPDYTFELIGWHVLTVLGFGMTLIVVPQKKMVELIVFAFKSIIKKFTGAKE